MICTESRKGRQNRTSVTLASLRDLPALAHGSSQRFKALGYFKSQSLASLFKQRSFPATMSFNLLLEPQVVAEMACAATSGTASAFSTFPNSGSVAGESADGCLRGLIVNSP